MRPVKNVPRPLLFGDALTATFPQRIRVVYFEKDEFPEMEAFMKDVSETYGFEFLTYALSYKDGMQDLVESYGVKVRLTRVHKNC